MQLEKHAVKTNDEVDALYAVIKEIWPEVFTPIIGADQVAYMLRTYQSPENILSEIKRGANYFVLKEGNVSVGYTAYEVKEEAVYISKIYLNDSVRGKGYSSALFDWYEEVAQENHKNKLYLRVNQENAQAIAVYEHKGFINKGVLVSPIGEGFEMTDFIFEKEISQ
ncbi:GNAT family N-acetyltransferase [Enterococcus sp. AZ194]|uniref:GNAT family N-acetyltransferase n=1 Tax=Enterococcus sp. AZ194 TaxID=2774629 RepID=UPI003F685565